MKFKPNDRIRFIDSSDAGIVLEVIGNRLMVKTDHGFELEIPASKVVKEMIPDEYDLNYGVEEKFIKGKVTADLTNKIKSKKSPLVREMEIDLHIYELVDSTRNLTNGEMLQIQVRYFRNKLKEAFAKRMTKLIVIHGVGEGVLRSEIRHLLREYENIEMLDADHKKYGAGATEVRIWYK